MDEHKLGFLKQTLFPLITMGRNDLEALFSKQMKSHLMRSYSLEDIRKLRDALAWALDEKTLDFKSLLPDLRFSNLEIRQYLDRYLGKINQMFTPLELDQLSPFQNEHPLRLLIIEDSQVDHGFLSHLLSDEYFVVSTVFTTIEAVQMLEKETFNLIILSLHEEVDSMINSMETLEKFENVSGNNLPPVLAVLDKEEAPYLSSLFKLGIKGYLEHPINISPLEQKIKEVLS